MIQRLLILLRDMFIEVKVSRHEAYMTLAKGSEEE